MKKFLTIALAALATFSASAEGYQVNTLSARQVAMGHTGVAQKLGAESMYFNPAALSFSNKTLDLSAGVTGIISTAGATINNKYYETDNKVSTPLYVHAAFKVYDNLQAGVSFYTPYGSNINWSKNWAGAVLNQSVKLSTYVVQPTLSYRILKNLSVGVGLCIAWGSVDLNKALVNPKSLDMLINATQMPVPTFGETSPASVNLKGTAEVAVGYNVGIMWDINEHFTLGLSARSEMQMKVKTGDATVEYANEIAEQLLQDKIGVINSANFKAEMPMPMTTTIGVCYKPNKRWKFAFDAQMTKWNAYENLDIEFLSEQLNTFNQHIEKNYKNAWAFRVGAQYALTDRMDLRAGFNYDMTPVDNNFYNPETPGMDKISPSLGFSFRPYSRLSIDVACAYVHGLSEDNASCNYDDFIYKNYPQFGQPATQTIKGKYTVHAWTPSIGVSYSF